MVQVCSKLTKAALLSVGIALILGSCIMPVDINDFLNDPDVQGIINNRGGGIDTNIDYENEEDLKPPLESNVGDPGEGGSFASVADKGTITVSLVDHSFTNGKPATIRVIDDSPYASFEWYLNGIALSSTGSSITVDTEQSPFDMLVSGHQYSLTVTGTIPAVPGPDKPYSTEIFIAVID
jgi:hypothetical protein